MVQTRSKAKLEQSKMEEAARILIELSRQIPQFTRTLSHENKAYERAMAIAPQTKPGDTILMNFYINFYTNFK